MRFIFLLLGSEVDEIAVVDQFANERIDLPQSKLWGTFEIATNEAVFMHSHFESSRSRHLRPRRYRTSWPSESTPRMRRIASFSELGINKVAECTDVGSGASGSPQ